MWNCIYRVIVQNDTMEINFTDLRHGLLKKNQEVLQLDPNLWVSHAWEYRYASVCHRYLKKNCQYLVWPPFVSCSATHLHCIELIRLLIVACGMLSHSSSLAVGSCWILAGTGTCCHTCRSRASETCSMGDMSGEYAGHWRTGTFLASRNCV